MNWKFEVLATEIGGKMGNSGVFNVGDTVEAVFVGDNEQKRRGLLTKVLANGNFVVELGTSSALCSQPRKIAQDNFTQYERWWMQNRRKELLGG